MMGSPRQVVALALVLLTVALNAAMLWTVLETDLLARLSASQKTPLEGAGSYVLLGGFAAVTVISTSVGALLANRSGAVQISSVLLAGGTLLTGSLFGYVVGGQLVMSDPASVGSNALLLGPLLFPAGLALMLPGLALTFPDGRLPSSALRAPLAFSIAILGCGTVLALITPGQIGYIPGSHNPVGITAFTPPVAGLSNIVDGIGILSITILGVAAVILRYRSGTPLVRAQLRWFLAATVTTAVTICLSIAPNIAGKVGGEESGLVSILSFLLVPISVGIAIKRYRLYDIDRIISRTLAYAVLTAILAAVYVAGFLAVQAVLATFTANGGPVAVAASTLVVFALFQPGRRRIQGAVDRRFYRSRYDAQREIESFTARVRDEVEVDRLAVALSTTLERTMQPASSSIWLRGAAR
jgi:hypothetical protein